MKKILIMMALIVGFGVSAQRGPRVANINVNPSSGDDKEMLLTWNTSRAELSQYRIKSAAGVEGKDGKGLEYHDNAYKDANTSDNGGYGLVINKDFDDVTYQISAERKGHIAFSKVRIFKIIGGSVNSIDDRTIGIKVKGRLAQKFKGRTVFLEMSQGWKITSIKYEGSYSILQAEIPDRLKTMGPELMARINFLQEKKNMFKYIWFKQSI